MPIKVKGKGKHFEVEKKSDLWKSLGKVLVDTDEKLMVLLEKIREERPPAIAFDTETTSKDFNDLEIVGCSLAWDLKEGYYIPLGHKFGESLELNRFIPLWETIHETAKIIPAYNKRFDYRVVRKTLNRLNHPCPEPIESKMFEISAIVWNADTDRWGKRAALKKVAKAFLGWDMDSFEDTLGEDSNFSMKTPEEVYVYAAMDSLILLHLMQKLKEIWVSRKMVVDLDDQMTTALIDIEDQKHPVDIEFCKWAIDENKKESEERLRVLKQEVVERVLEKNAHRPLETEEEKRAWVVRKLMQEHSLNLNTLNLNSAPEMAKLFGKVLGVDTGTYSDKTGAISFSEKALESFEMRGGSDSTLKKAIEYRKNLKNLGYLEKFVEEGSDGGIRCAYNTTRVTTGRLSASASPGNSYFYSASIHTVKKPKKRQYLAVPGSEILGFDFLPVVKKEEELFLEDGRKVGSEVHGVLLSAGRKDHTNIRRALCAKEGHYVVHVDYNAEEVRILGNLTNDKSLIETFEKGVDPHTQTVVDMFGDFIPEKRDLCKGINFLSSYGGSAFALANKLGIPKSEAEMYLNKWWRVRAGVRIWKKNVLQKAMATGYVETALGRIRWVDYLVMSKNFVDRSQGERLCLNSPIQGTAGDLLRLVLTRLHRNVWLKEREDFQILSTVHDEVNFSVKKERVFEFAKKIEEEMDITLPGWRIPMTADFEIGTSWGILFKFGFSEEGVPYPIGKAV